MRHDAALQTCSQVEPGVWRGRAGHGDNVSGGGRHTGPALCSQQPGSLVTGPIGCCCSGPRLARLPRLAGQGESPPWPRCCCCHAVTRCHEVSRSHHHQAEAGLSSGRQLQLASFSATFGWITRADKTSPAASSLSCGKLIFDIN